MVTHTIGVIERNAVKAKYHIAVGQAADCDLGIAQTNPIGCACKCAGCHGHCLRVVSHWRSEVANKFIAHDGLCRTRGQRSL